VTKKPKSRSIEKKKQGWSAPHVRFRPAKRSKQWRLQDAWSVKANEGPEMRQPKGEL
jgi:hypothetical protein